MTDEVAISGEILAGEEAELTASGAAAVADELTARTDPAVREARFVALSDAPQGPAGLSVDLIMDLQVDLAAELGRTSMLIRDLMELHPGSIIELRKVVGEPIDLLANGKTIARGEVVVVDESFGVRVTEIVSTARPDGAS